MMDNWWMDKQDVWYPYNGTLLSHKKEWNTDWYYHVDVLNKHANIMLNKRNETLMYESIYIMGLD